MVIKETAWGFLIDQGQMGRCVWGAEKNEIIELNKTYRGTYRRGAFQPRQFEGS